MEDAKERLEEGKKIKQPEPLSPCTVAPSAEHARADNEDEPCDDGRAGG